MNEQYLQCEHNTWKKCKECGDSGCKTTDCEKNNWKVRGAGALLSLTGSQYDLMCQTCARGKRGKCGHKWELCDNCRYSGCESSDCQHSGKSSSGWLSSGSCKVCSDTKTDKLKCVCKKKFKKCSKCNVGGCFNSKCKNYNWKDGGFFSSDSCIACK